MPTAMEYVTISATAQDSWTLMAMASAITTVGVDAVDADAAAVAWTLSIVMVMVSVTTSAITAETLTATEFRTGRTTIMIRCGTEAAAVMADRTRGVIDKSVLCAWNYRALFFFIR